MEHLINYINQPPKATTGKRIKRNDMDAFILAGFRQIMLGQSLIESIDAVRDTSLCKYNFKMRLNQIQRDIQNEVNRSVNGIAFSDGEGQALFMQYNATIDKVVEFLVHGHPAAILALSDAIDDLQKQAEDYENKKQSYDNK